MTGNKQGDVLESPERSIDRPDELSYLRSKVADLSSLIEISIIINSTLDLDRLVALVMEKAQAVMNSEASSVLLVNEETNMLECEVALGEVGHEVKKIQLQMGEGIAGWVAQHGEPQIIPDVAADARFAAKIDDSTGFQTRSILAVPLIVQDRVIGVAEVINRNDGKAYNDDDLALFSTFCRQVAMAIENARMHQVQLEKQKLEQQLESARIIQQSFMPEIFPDSSELGYAISARSLPATSVGGDFFDFIEFEKASIGIAVGDVTGKGVPAALHMARLVSDFRLFTQNHRSPTKLLGELNRVLVDRSRRGMFVTFQYGVLYTSTSVFTYSNAGHIPFIRINALTGAAELLEEATGIPLGIAAAAVFAEASVTLGPGDYVVSITDGIIEAKNKDGEAYSMERAVDVLTKPVDSAEQMVENLLQDVQTFSKDMQQHDDLTVFVLRRN